MNSPEIRALTGLRFLIAFWVFIFHIQIRWPIFDDFALASIANQGAIGMTFFFILSGFILSYSYSAQFSISSYFRSRIARIYPIYILAALITLPWLIFPDFVGRQLPLLEVTFLLVVGFLLLQAWFPPTFPLWNNGGSWSISVEAFFYICFPLLKKKIDKLDRRTIYKLLFASYFMILLVSFSVYLYQSEGMSLAYSMPIFRIFEFTFGMLAFKLFCTNDSIFSNRVLFHFLFFIFLFNLIFIGEKLPLYVTHDWIAVPFFVFLLINLVKFNSLLSKILASGFFNLLGRASYSFYSLQVFFILSSIKWKAKVQSNWSLLENNQAFALIAFLILTLSSILVYKFIEEPLRKRINKQT